MVDDDQSEGPKDTPSDHDSTEDADRNILSSGPFEWRSGAESDGESSTGDSQDDPVSMTRRGLLGSAAALGVGSTGASTLFSESVTAKRGDNWNFNKGSRYNGNLRHTAELNARDLFHVDHNADHWTVLEHPSVFGKSVPNVQRPDVEGPQNTSWTTLARGSEPLHIYVHGHITPQNSARNQFDTVSAHIPDVQTVGYSWDALLAGQKSHTDSSPDGFPLLNNIPQWQVNRSIANLTGKVLAGAIYEIQRRNPDKKIRITGYSLGSQVTLSCIRNLNREPDYPNGRGVLKSAGLIGGAVPRKANVRARTGDNTFNWETSDRRITSNPKTTVHPFGIDIDNVLPAGGEFDNRWSDQDETLSREFYYGEKFKTAIGDVPLRPGKDNLRGHSLAKRTRYTQYKNMAHGGWPIHSQVWAGIDSSMVRSGIKDSTATLPPIKPKSKVIQNRYSGGVVDVTKGEKKPWAVQRQTNGKITREQWYPIKVEEADGKTWYRLKLLADNNIPRVLGIGKKVNAFERWFKPYDHWVTATKWTGSHEQQWRFIKQGDYTRIQNRKDGSYLDLESKTNSDGTYLVTYGSQPNSKTQQWKLANGPLESKASEVGSNTYSTSTTSSTQETATVESQVDDPPAGLPRWPPVGPTTVNPDNWPSGSGNYGGGTINSVEMGSQVANPQVERPSDDDDYEDLTDEGTVVVEPGGQIEIAVDWEETAGSDPNYITAHVDWEQNQDWSTAQETTLLTSSYSGGTDSGTIDVPADADGGATLLRLRLGVYELGYGYAEPSEDAAGEVNDFSVYVADDPSLSVTTNEPTNVDGGSATLRGTVTGQLDRLGRFDDVEAYFVYTDGEDVRTTARQTITSAGEFSADVSGLTSLQYQAVAVSTRASDRGEVYSQTVQAPYNGPHALPGRVQAEDFDTGGEGVAYYDTSDGNEGGGYRDTNVDIQPAGEDGYDNTVVGWISSGEWWEYTVDVESSGTFGLTARVASADGGGAFTVSVDGTDVASTSFGDTGGWQNLTTVDVGTVDLEAGEHVVRVTADQGSWNFDWFEFGQAPYNGPHTLPGRVQAEDFDTGGEGVAYHDTSGGNEGGAYRNTDVDIQNPTQDRYNVGWMATDEWLEYTVDVESSGSYYLTARVSSDAGGGAIAVSVDGTEVASTSFDGTGGWENWTNVYLGAVDLDAGEHVVRVTVDESGWDFDWFEFSQSYKVGSLDDLQAVRNDLDADYELTSDIDASATASWNGGNGFDPIGGTFTGTFDGNGHTISNLHIDRGDTDYVGLFAKLAGTIRNIKLTDVSVTADDFAGALVGRLTGGNIIESSASGEVVGDWYVGGLVGHVAEEEGYIKRSSAAVSVSATENVGGLLGGLGSDSNIRYGRGYVRDSYATGSVSGDVDIGGLVGDIENGEVKRSYATGTVTASENPVGGLIGEVDYSGGADAGYWDTETTGQSDGIGENVSNTTGNTGLTTDEMTGSSAESNMDGLDFQNVWETRSGDYPGLR